MVRRSRAGLAQGVAVSALGVPVLVALGMRPPAAQLGVVCVLGVWWGLGLARDSFLAAGAQLDAVLATLPPPDRSSRSVDRPDR